MKQAEAQPASLPHDQTQPAHEPEAVMDQIELQFTCERSWDDLDGHDGAVRRCEECKHDIYNVTSMSRDEAHEFLRGRDGQRTCIAYERSPTGRTLHADDPELRLRAQHRGLGRLLAVGAAVPLLLSLVKLPLPADATQPYVQEYHHARATAVTPIDLMSANAKVVVNFLEEELSDPEPEYEPINIVDAPGHIQRRGPDKSEIVVGLVF